MEKKGLQRLLKKARLPQQLLVNFDRSVIESVITCCIAVWYSGCTSENKKSLQRIIETAEKITSSPVWRTFTGHVALGSPRDPSHPGHNMFTRLPSGKRYRTLYAHTTRLKMSFYHIAVDLLNTTPSIVTPIISLLLTFNVVTIFRCISLSRSRCHYTTSALATFA